MTFSVGIVFIILEQKPNLNHIKKYAKKVFCIIAMPSGDTKISEFNQNRKAHEAPFIIYPDIECLIEKLDRYKNNLKNSS